MSDQGSTPDGMCPAAGRKGRLDFSAPGDEWYVICPVCGARWAGGSDVLDAHRDPRAP